ncbi:MAG: SDR family oxidoreductase [Lysobacterales bacterium]
MASSARTALITGASAGLGACFARQLAQRGWRLVLTARRLDRLQALAAELTPQTQVACLALDLAEPGSPARLIELIDQHGWQIDMLVNNAGFGLPGDFLSHDWDTHESFLRLMLVHPTELAHRLLGGMCERGFGRIINVSSVAGLVPGTAGHTLYAASKSYLVKLSQSLALEHRHQGVYVSALCPGFTYTEFHDVNGTRPMASKMPRFMWMDADPVVAAGIEAVERGQIVCVPGWWNRFIYALVSWLPDSWALGLVDRRSKAFRKR